MVVRMRHTRAHTKNRRSHHGLKDQNLSTCSHCGAAHRPHHMCLECGYYNGRLIMDMAAEKAKREARIKAKEEIRRSELSSTDEPEVSETESATQSNKSDSEEDKEEKTEADEKPKK